MDLGLPTSHCSMLPKVSACLVRYVHVSLDFKTEYTLGKWVDTRNRFYIIQFSRYTSKPTFSCPVYQSQTISIAFPINHLSTPQPGHKRRFGRPPRPLIQLLPRNTRILLHLRIRVLAFRPPPLPARQQPRQRRPASMSLRWTWARYMFLIARGRESCHQPAALLC